MGLNRLGIDTATTAVAGERTSAAVVGYVSQYLNPLSGQCGCVARPVPFPRPVLYEVTHPGGVDVHSGSELSTARIGRASRGTVLSIVGRGFTDHPRDDCAERLKLSGGGGWISSRGGGGREEDKELLVRIVSIDASFDPDEPGRFHLNSTMRIMEELLMVDANDDVGEIGRKPDQGVGVGCGGVGTMTSISIGGGGSGGVGANDDTNTVRIRARNGMTTTTGLSDAIVIPSTRRSLAHNAELSEIVGEEPLREHQGSVSIAGGCDAASTALLSLSMKSSHFFPEDSRVLRYLSYLEGPLASMVEVPSSPRDCFCRRLPPRAGRMLSIIPWMRYEVHRPCFRMAAVPVSIRIIVA
jgi:hypothetical protein